MKLRRTINFNFGWIVLVALVDVAFLLVFFLLLSSNFILQQGISISMPFSRFTLGPQISHQIISISGGAVPAIYFQDQRVTMEQLGLLLDAAKRNPLSLRPTVLLLTKRLPKWQTLRSNMASLP